MDVSVIIVNYNTKELLKNCIQSIINITRDLEYEIVVVDNNSSDNSVEMIKDFFPKVKVIVSKENEGFGRANNKGAEKCSGKYILMLNSDTILLNNAIKEFHAFFKNNKDVYNIGALGAVMQDGFGAVIHSYENFPTMKYFLKQNIKNAVDYDKILSKLKQNNVIKMDDSIKKTNLKKVDYITGADLFMEKRLFKELNGFDEDFFMYFEESHMQYRMSKLNKQRYVITSPKIIHLEGKSSISNKRRVMFDKSMMMYFRKTNSRLKFNIFKSAYLLVTLVSFFTVRDYTFKDNLNYLKEYNYF